MHIVVLVAFQFQVECQCRYILLAFDELEAASTARDFHRVFFAAQNLLAAAANVSKALWGVHDLKGKTKADRKPLRDSIQVKDVSPLREVAMRNHYEHFDERIDKWWHTSKDHKFVDLTLGDPSQYGPTGMGDYVDSDVFRSYDPQTRTLYFWGQEFKLQEIIDEVNRILPILEEELQKPRWTEVH